MSNDRASLDGLLARLPHRHPFVMVDRVLSCVPGERVEGLIHVGARDQTRFQLTPLLLGEALAQLSKALELTSDPEAAEISFLASLQVELAVDEKPTEDIHLVAERERAFQAMVSYRMRATSGARTLLEGQLTRRRKAP